MLVSCFNRTVNGRYREQPCGFSQGMTSSNTTLIPRHRAIQFSMGRGKTCPPIEFYLEQFPGSRVNRIRVGLSNFIRQKVACGLGGRFTNHRYVLTSDVDFDAHSLRAGRTLVHFPPRVLSSLYISYYIASPSTHVRSWGQILEGLTRSLDNNGSTIS